MTATKMNYFITPITSAPIAVCPDCDSVCVYWDEDDLDEDGDLLCYHYPADDAPRGKVYP